MLLLLLVLALSDLISDLLTKDYYFLFARACFNIAQRKPDRVDKIRYFILAIKGYNIYLRRKFGLQIKSLDVIFDGITRTSGTDTVEILRSVSRAADGDKLDIAGYLAKTFLKEPTKDQLLTTHIYVTRLKDVSITFVIPVITIIITAIDVFFVK